MFFVLSGCLLFIALILSGRDAFRFYALQKREKIAKSCWLCHVRPEVVHIQKAASWIDQDYDELEDWEWDIFTFDQNHAELYRAWCKAKLELCEFDRSMVRFHELELVEMLARAPEEFESRLINLLYQ
ncbi:MAG: hypothetical protein JWM20_222 [Patescibacteria group bacterium]|nr:hypothetical protein [Patescibacteria group bacterium]